MPTHCEIRFDNPTGVYYAGQELTGTAHLTTDHEKTIRAIHIEVDGQAKVSWSETRVRSENGKTKTYKVYFTAREQYLASRTYTVGYEGAPAIALLPGRYQYNFRCLLPPQLPTTFNGNYGSIRYEVKLTLDRPYRFDNVFKQGFTVIQPVDLNLNPQHRRPAERRDEKVYCCCCCQSGPLEVKLTTHYSGFVPGQRIDFVLFLGNESTVDIEGSVVELKKEITYEAETPSRKQKHQSENLVNKKLGSVLRLTRKEFRDYLTVPPLPPTTDACKCIKINYFLVAKVVARGCHEDLKLMIPITIGTVPLVNLTPGPSPMTEVITAQPSIIPSAPLLSSQSVDSDVPPSYESMGVHLDIVGYVKVRWRDRGPRSGRLGHRRRSRTFSSQKQYLSQQTYVLGNETAALFELPPATYKYTFRSDLPSHLPTSFDGLFGYIRYEVVLTIDRPLKFDNVFKQAFTLIGPLDLNLDPIYREPIQKVQQRSFFCCCCKSGPLEITFSVPQSGFAPGQKIHFHLDIDNDSAVSITQIAVCLRKEITYESETPRKRIKLTSEAIKTKQFGRLLKFNKREFRDYISLPPIPPSSLDPTRLIKFKYYLYALMQTEGFHRNVRMTIPIVVGTVPLLTLPSTQETSAQSIDFLSYKVNTETDVPPSYDSILPPSYEEAITNEISEDFEDEKHKCGPFTAKYPVYHEGDTEPEDENDE